MQNYIACTIVAALALTAAGAAEAGPIEITAEAPGVLLPAGLSATLLSFDNLPVGNLPSSYQFSGGTLSGAGAIENTSIIGMSAQPAGSGTGYLTASYPSAGGATQLNFSSPENYFGLYWGSMDSWNSITFMKGGQQIAAYSGTEIAGLTGLVANGDQQSPSSNRYINFNLGAVFYDEVILGTTNWGFEVDNIAFGDPPAPISGSSGAASGATLVVQSSLVIIVQAPTPISEPGSLLMLGSSFYGFALMRRRQRSGHRVPRAQYERGMPRTCWPR